MMWVGGQWRLVRDIELLTNYAENPLFGFNYII